MLATAYVRLAQPVSSHDDIPDPKSDPVSVLMVNSQGAHLSGDLPEGTVTLYDILTYKEEIRVEKILVRYEEIPVDPPPLQEGETPEDDPEPRFDYIPVYEDREIVNQVAVLDTFAVSVPVEGA